MDTDRVLRIATVTGVLVLAVIGLAMPSSLVIGGGAWLGVMFAACSGWGWLVVRGAKVEDVDFGLRTAWGVAALLAIAGLFVLFGVCTRATVLGLCAVGLAGFGWRELVTPAPAWLVVRAAGRFIQQRPVIGALVIAFVLIALIAILGALVTTERNPWDDDLAYTPLVRRLLQIGDLIEPFSFRRLAAYGGQTVLQALAAARGSTVAVHVADRGFCFGLVLLLVTGHARGRTPALWLGLVTALLLLLPELAVNTASYWSGATLFFALYRTIELGDTSDGKTRELFAIAALVGAATCTLRHSYAPVVVVFLVAIAASRVARYAAETSLRVAWHAEWRRWRPALALAALALLPWCAASFLSSRSLLFPVMQGTWNHALPLSPPSWTWADTASFFVTCCLEVQPIAIGIVFVALLPFVVDERPGRQLLALFGSGVVGFALLVHGFGFADPASLWRYAFGYTLPVVLALSLEAVSSPAPIRVSGLGRWVLLAALVVQIGFARTGVVKHYASILQEARAVPADAAEQEVDRARYAEMQVNVPPGERLLAMLDDPAFLDYKRNAIANVDTPGFASPDSQFPAFTGPEQLRAYLLVEGYRYVAFVRPERSRYFYRRAFWLTRVFNEGEMGQVTAAYAIDLTDNLLALAGRTHVLYDQGGLVALDLGGPDVPHEALRDLDPADEPARRDAFVRELAVREHLHDEWALSSRREIVFADGLGALTFLDPNAPSDPHWNDAVDRGPGHDPEPSTGRAVRWMHRRAHWRVKGDRAMHLALRGHVNLNALYSRPRLDVSIDGELLASAIVDPRGDFTIDVVVPADLLDGWCDLYAVWSTIGQPDKDIKDVRIARLEDVTWEPH